MKLSRPISNNLYFASALATYLLSMAGHSVLADPSGQPTVPATVTDLAGAGSIAVLAISTIKVLGPQLIELVGKGLVLVKDLAVLFTNQIQATRDERAAIRAGVQADKEREARERQAIRDHEVELAELKTKVDKHIDKRHERDNINNDLLMVIQERGGAMADILIQYCQDKGIPIPPGLVSLDKPLVVKNDPVPHIEPAGTDEMNKVVIPESSTR